MPATYIQHASATYALLCEPTENGGTLQTPILRSIPPVYVGDTVKFTLAGGREQKTVKLADFMGALYLDDNDATNNIPFLDTETPDYTLIKAYIDGFFGAEQVLSVVIPIRGGQSFPNNFPLPHVPAGYNAMSVVSVADGEITPFGVSVVTEFGGDVVVWDKPAAALVLPFSYQSPLAFPPSCILALTDYQANEREVFVNLQFSAIP